MADLVEVVFEGVDNSCVVQLFNSLMRSSDNLLTAQCSEDIELFDFDNGKLIEGAKSQLLDSSGDISILATIKSLSLDDFALPNTQLRLVKYGNSFDIEFNFDYNDLESITMNLLMCSLHKYARKIAQEYDVRSFFGGMEPATDEEMRYFTNEIKGPLTY